LGHVLFVGLGAAAGAGLAPWLGLVPAGLVAMAAAAAVAAATGALAQRCGRDHGAVFTLLTLIFAEAGRLALTPLPRLGGGPGLGAAPGGPVAVYYLMLAMTLGLLVLSRLLLRSRRGRRWLAVREDPVTAAAIGIDPAGARLSALAVSAALTAPAGLVLAWGGLPAATDPLSWLTRSIEIGLVAMVGGVGTLIGPVLGAMVVAPAAAGLDWLALRPGHHPLPGLTGLGLGLALVLAVVVVPRGLWPGLARRLGLLAGERRR
jgi:branched-chain amino acid transport system permease protein